MRPGRHGEGTLTLSQLGSQHAAHLPRVLLVGFATSTCYDLWLAASQHCCHASSVPARPVRAAGRGRRQHARAVSEGPQGRGDAHVTRDTLLVLRPTAVPVRPSPAPCISTHGACPPPSQGRAPITCILCSRVCRSWQRTAMFVLGLHETARSSHHGLQLACSRC